MPLIIALFISIVFVAFPAGLAAQTDVVAVSTSRFPFIRKDLNFIDNNYKGMKNFYEQLHLLQKGQRRTINIVHIGDSHLQADWFSGMVRMRLHKRFGAAGRGLVFPYRVAKTNSPDDIFSSSNVNWEVRKNIQSRGSLGIGISGISLRTRSSNFLMKLSLEENPLGIDYSFNRVTFFTEKGSSLYDMVVSTQARPTGSVRPQAPPTTSQPETYHMVQRGENLTSIATKYKLTVRQLMDLNDMEKSTIYAGKKLLVKSPQAPHSEKVQEKKPVRSSVSAGMYPVSLTGNPNESYMTSVDFDKRIQSLYLRGKKASSSQNQMTLYGMVLENTRQSGILYHMIGVNGAKFEHYNGSSKLLRQVQELQPDLIILSLGTNETAYRIFNSSHFFSQLDEFVYDLEQYMPYADILITTPPDALLSGRYDNKNVKKAKDILLRYALNNDLACWNFFEIMGGLGSVRAWYTAGLAQKDRLHLTQTGYELQGNLLFEALMSGYGSYQSVKSR